MILTFVVWGERRENYLESLFCMLTALPDPALQELCVVTDHPEFYASVRDKVRVIHIEPEEFSSWGGDMDFLYRRKIKGVEKAALTYPGHDILYLDSDTFRGDSLEGVASTLAGGKVCMGDSSGFISKAKDRNNRELYAKIRHKCFRRYTVDATSIRLNAGIVGLPGALALEVLDDVLAICDEMHDLTGYYGTEEVAFSFGLAKQNPVVDIGRTIGHYWGNKPAWDAAIKEFFAFAMMRKPTFDDLVNAAGAFNFKSIPLYIHKPRRHRQLEKIAHKYWPPCRQRHYPEQPTPWL